MRNFGALTAWGLPAGVVAAAQAVVPDLQVLACVLAALWCATILVLIFVGVFGPKEQAKHARGILKMLLARPAPPTKAPPTG